MADMQWVVERVGRPSTPGHEYLSKSGGWGTLAEAQRFGTYKAAIAGSTDGAPTIRSL